MALLKIFSSAPQCKLLGTIKRVAQVLCVLLVQVKKAHPSLQCHPLPIECQADKEEKREHQVGKQQKLLPGHLDGFRCAVLSYCMETCSHARMQAKGCKQNYVPGKMSKALSRPTDADWCSGRRMRSVAHNLPAGQLLHRLECLIMAIVSRKVT